jgi:hypothetical protein
MEEESSIEEEIAQTQPKNTQTNTSTEFQLSNIEVVPSPDVTQYTNGIPTNCNNLKTQREILRSVSDRLNPYVPGFVPRKIEEDFYKAYNAVTALQLPRQELVRLDGNLVEFDSYIMAFECIIQFYLNSNSAKLYFLDQHLVGDPKSVCFHVNSEIGYEEAKQLLKNMLILTRFQWCIFAKINE